MNKPLYEITQWDATYECAQSRKEQRNRWVAIPNKHDGRGFNRIALHKNSVELFAAWILIVQVASKMPVRGVLSDKDGPLTAEDLALKTRFPLHIFELALSYLILPEIGWMRVSDYTGSSLVASSERTGSALVASSELHDSTLQNITGQDKTKHFFVPAQPKRKKKESITETAEPQSITSAARAWSILVKRMTDQQLPEDEEKVVSTSHFQEAVKMVGGGKYLSKLEHKYLPSVKKDFIAAYNQASKQ